MRDRSTAHPTDKTLRQFIAGLLSDEECQRIEAHLSGCDECALALDQSEPPDDFLAALLRDHALEWVIEAKPQQQAANAGADCFDTLIPAVGEQAGASQLRTDRYVIQSELGRGGMGIVYAAFDATLRRNVALKFIPPDRVLREDSRIRFRREAEAAARLQHANIVQVFDFSDEGDSFYIAFELVEGGSFAAQIKRQPLELRDSASLIATLADAVSYAHQRDVIHRDLKPANILLTHNGTPKIADFGLAKLLDGDESQTVDGELMGSPSYMAPEQARGDSAAIGPATDIYALGAILYEAAVGQPPFREKTLLATLDKIRSEPPTPPRRIRKSIDRDYENICLKCLAKEPAARYAKAEDIAADLRRYLGGMPVVARKASTAEQLFKLVRRHPFAAGASCLFATLLLAFSVIVSLYNQRLTETNDQVRRQATEVLRSSYALHLQRVADKTRSNPNQALLLLRDEDLCPAELRDFCWHYLRRACDRQVAAWDHGEGVLSVAVSPDGSRIASGDRAGVVRIWSGTSPSPLRVIEAHHAQVNALSFSGDSSVLFTAGDDGSVKKWGLEGGINKPVETFASEAERVNGIAFRPDRAQLAAALSDGRIQVWDLNDDRVVADFQAHPKSVLRLAFGNDGALLATVSRDRTLCLWKAGDWTELARVDAHDGPVHDVAFHPIQNDRLTTAGADQTLRGWVVAAGNRLEPGGAPVRAGTTINTVAYAPGGAFLAAGLADGTVRVLRPTNGRQEAVLQQAEHPITSVAFCSDTEILSGAGDGIVRQWTRAHGDLPTVIPAHGSSVTGLVFGSDGETLASTSLDGRLRLSNAETGNLQGEWNDPDGWITGVGLSPDKQSIVWESSGVAYTAQLRSGQELEATPFSVELNQPLAVALGEGGLVTVEWSGVKFYHPVTGALQQAWSEGEVHRFSLSPDASHVSLVNDRGVLWLGDLQARRFRSLAELGSGVSCLGMSHDGQRIAFGTAQGMVVLVDPDTGAEVAELQGHSGPVLCLAFSPDNKTLATAGEDGEIKLWDGREGPERLTIDSGEGVSALTFAPDSRALAAGGVDGNLLIWRAAKTSSAAQKNLQKTEIN